MGFKFNSCLLLFHVIEVLFLESVEKYRPGVMDVVSQQVQGVPPFRYTFDPLIDFISFDIQYWTAKNDNFSSG